MRVFAFGCSFTQYLWPTWADVVGRSLGGTYQNWGLAGAGNVFIMNRFVECLTRHQIGADDVVLIMWSTAYREDRYINGRWNTHGNIYNQSFYDDAFMRYYDDRGALLKSFNAIVATNRLATQTGARTIFTSFLPIAEADEYNPRYGDSDIVAHYQPFLTDMLVDYRSHMLGDRPWPIKHFIDGPDLHPLPRAHLRFAEEVVLPRLAVRRAPDEVRAWIDRWQAIVDYHDCVDVIHRLWLAERTSKPKSF
jgi:hypothetical protein